MSATTTMTESTHERVRAQARRQTIALALVIVVGLGGVVGVSRWIETHRPPVDAAMEEEKLYVTGQAARRMSLGFSGLVADWYWMRSLQYVGRKLVAQPGDVQIDDLKALNLHLLYPLLDTATTLDPQFMAAYEYGGVVLPAINDEDAIKLLKKGLANNPTYWRFHQYLGFIYWKRGDFKTASAVYAEGARIPGVPSWMQQMSARMEAEGGSRALAREMYQRMMDESDDEQVKELAARRILQVQSFEERDVIRRVLEEFKQRHGRCATDWREVTPQLRAERLPDGSRLRLDASGAPRDPADTAYLLIKEGCDVDLDTHSKVPYR
jgi:tetratricopeptide (TPR) repeat protein